MRCIPTKLKDVVLMEPDIFRDSRGFFLEFFNAQKFAEMGVAAVFVQDNHSKSVQGTLRGLHAQLSHPQGKLVRVVQGEILDVAVDARPDSPTFGQWEGHILSGDNILQMYIPPGFLHGFYVQSPTAEVEYKCTDYYDPSDEIGVIWSDPSLKIQWPSRSPLLSQRDTMFPAFDGMKGRFEQYRGLLK